MYELDKYSLRANLLPYSNFSFEIADHERWEKVQINNSLFNGSVFVDCFFSDVNFNNSDLEGTRFSKCSFWGCTFDSADIHSIWINDCHFNNVDFNESNMTDCNFHSCVFEQCGFNGIIQMECIFSDCEFDSFSPHNSSITLNHYTRTTFHNAFFKNVFYYHWFENCHLPNATFEAYLLGYVYGLTIENLNECRFVMMGEKNNCAYEDIDDVYYQVKDIYETRHMYLNIGILALGNPNNNKDSILLGCISLLSQLLGDNQLLKNEQIKFFEKLISVLYKQKQIAPVTIYRMEREIIEIIESYKGRKDCIAWEKAEKNLVVLKNTLYFIFLEFLDKLESPLHTLPNGKKLALQVIYEDEPLLQLTSIISAMLPKCPPPVRVRTEKGSFIEYINVVSDAIPYIDLFLKLMGITVPIILAIRKEKREDKKETSTACQNSEQLTVAVSLSKQFLNVSLPADTGDKITQAVNVIINFNTMGNNQKMGYSCENLKEVKVIPRVKAHRGSR